jgi:hypothetical protein
MREKAELKQKEAEKRRKQMEEVGCLLLLRSLSLSYSLSYSLFLSLTM